MESFGESRNGEGHETIQSTVFLLGEGIGGLGVEEGTRLRQEATAAAGEGPGRVWGWQLCSWGAVLGGSSEIYWFALHGAWGRREAGKGRLLSRMSWGRMFQCCP